MSTLIYTYQIPDLSRPIPEEMRKPWSPSGELIDFVPEPFDAAKIIGRSIAALSCNVGSYGMGGPGFFGLRLDGEWLIIALWGAAEWMRAEGRAIGDIYHDLYDRPRPWVSDTYDDLSPAIVGRRISGIEVGKQSLRIGVDGGPELIIEESAESRPVFEGTKAPRIFTEEDDLRRAVFLAPTDELWV